MEPRGRGKARGGRGRGEQPQQTPKPGQGPGPQRAAGSGVAPPQGAWGRPQTAPQGARPQTAPQGAWAKPQQPPATSQKDPSFAGRGSRVGGGDDGAERSDAPRVTGGAGDGSGLRECQPKERGGGNGVRGRTTRTEMINTRPKHIQSKQGTSGSLIKLTANYFKFVNRPDWCLHQYRVDFMPEVDDTRRKRKLVSIAFRREHNIGGFLFDGTVLYTPLILNPDPLVRVTRLEDSENITISVRRVGEVGSNDYQYLNIFNLIVRKCLNLMKLQLVDRDYFDPTARIDVPDHRLCIWPGYFTSIRQYEKEIMLTCELKNKIMRTDNVYDLLLNSVDRSGRSDVNLFRNKMIGSIVLTFYNNKTYRIDDIDFDQSPTATFPLRNGERISYMEYYKNKYGVNIQVPTQPLLISRPSARELRAGMPEVVYLIPELCQLTGLTDDQRGNFQLMGALAQHTRIGPGPRQARLQEFARKMAGNPDVMAEVKQWDLNLANRLVEFQGRVLPQEKIRVGQEMSFPSGPKADWTNNLRSNSMLVAGRMEKMVVICPVNLQNDTEGFMQNICKAAQGMRWNIQNSYRLFPIQNDRSGSYLDKIEEVASMNPTMIMTVLQSKTADRYNAIKKKCYADRGIPNQVVVARNFRSKGVMSIATKIVIQMNCKIGGAPWTVPIPAKDLMIVGYDVCRDTAKSSKSFGAMVATLDQGCTRYYSSVYEHTNAEELSNNFGTFMVLAVKKFYEERKCLPGRICIFRDGVGEGQIPYVFEHEVNNIRSKLETEFYKGENKLRMGFVIVTKRINTRIFNGDQNPPPGTVVDNTITLPEKYDYFIISQCVNQGTVGPTNYNVIYDTLGFSPDHYQQLTYKLCHLYFNWSGTVKVPAPCQYAHKLAQLTAQALHRPANKRLENLLYFL